MRMRSLRPTSFQFTPLREGRPSAGLRGVITAIFQFTPLREGRQEAEYTQNTRNIISIHAPPRGATALCQ